MVLPLEGKDISNICMLNACDFCFSARRDALPALSDLLSFFYNFRSDNTALAKILKYVNVDQLKQSEMQSVPYLYSFPVGILASNQAPDEFDLLLKEKHPPSSSSHPFIEAAAIFALSLHDHQYTLHFSNLARKSSSLIRVWDDTKHYRLFYNEFILARFYDFFGIYTYSYAGKIKTKVSRLATTNFALTILQMIENDNISFLSDTEIDWGKEIADYLKKGGRWAEAVPNIQGTSIRTLL
jgi:hypothetical protein